LDWWVLQFPLHAGVQRLVAYLNYLYKNEPAFFDQDDSYESFEWIDLHDADNSVLSFLRKASHGTTIAIVINSTPVVRHGYRLGVPHGGQWKEILNTDSEIYGGSNVGNSGSVHAEEVEWGNRPYSLCLTLPPLAVVALKWMD
jgi:1,4-alpha-glucan branching enzyme